MNEEQMKALREPFAPERVGKLPKVTCWDCRNDKATRNCAKHPKRECPTCGNYMTSSHMHIDYVGHAEATDRLLSVDPEWNWEPLARDERGLPVRDELGGMWIKLTIAGVTRLGYGDAAGKRGPDAVKEVIGDAIRNAAMRFGVALDLWGAKYDPPAGGDHPAASIPADDRPPMVTDKQHRHMHALWRDLGYGGDANRDTRLRVMAKMLGLSELGSSSELTEVQADDVIAALVQRRTEQKGKADDQG